MSDDIHERVAREIADRQWDHFAVIQEEVDYVAEILRREYGPMTDMHTTADEAAKVWMDRARKDEREIDLLKAKARDALEYYAKALAPHSRAEQVLKEIAAAMQAEDGMPIEKRVWSDLTYAEKVRLAREQPDEFRRIRKAAIQPEDGGKGKT